MEGWALLFEMKSNKKRKAKLYTSVYIETSVIVQNVKDKKTQNLKLNISYKHSIKKRKKKKRLQSSSLALH